MLQYFFNLVNLKIIHDIKAEPRLLNDDTLLFVCGLMAAYKYTELKFVKLKNSELSTNSTSRFFKDLINHTKLASIEISHCNLSDESMAYLGEVIKANPAIDSIDLSHNNITSSGTIHIFCSIRSTTAFAKINLGFNSLVDKCLEPLMKLLKNGLKIKNLDLTSCGLTNEAIYIISQGLEGDGNIELLNVSKNKGITIKSLDYLINHFRKSAISNIIINETEIDSRRTPELINIMKVGPYSLVFRNK